MRINYTTPLLILAGLICGMLTPTFLVLLKFSSISIFKSGRIISDFVNLKSTLTIFTPTEVIGIYSVIFTILIYAIGFTIIFLGIKFLFTQTTTAT